jgi:hypothetical protein
MSPMMKRYIFVFGNGFLIRIYGEFLDQERAEDIINQAEDIVLQLQNIL